MDDQNQSRPEDTVSRDEFLSLARLALAAKGNDVALFLQRTARRYRDKAPNLSKATIALLRDYSAANSITRRVENTPVDADSRLKLLRFEPDGLDAEPLLMPKVKNALEQVIEEREATLQLAAAGLQPTRSLLFVGPPGVGKTMSARWIALRLGKPLLVLDLSAVMSSFLGKTGGNIRAVFEHAKSQDCILFLDELDAVAKRRDDATEIGELKRLVTVILQEVDSWPSDRLLIAATNHPDLLDPAIWRRFDDIIEFERPNQELLKSALRQFIEDEDSLGSWEQTLLASLNGKSFSDVERFVLRIKRKAAISGRNLSEEIADAATGLVSSTSKQDKLQLAKNLIDSGVSQRRVSAITGVSRVTLRKKSNLSHVGE